MGLKKLLIGVELLLNHLDHQWWWILCCRVVSSLGFVQEVELWSRDVKGSVGSVG